MLLFTAFQCKATPWAPIVPAPGGIISFPELLNSGNSWLENVTTAAADVAASGENGWRSYFGWTIPLVGKLVAGPKPFLFVVVVMSQNGPAQKIWIFSALEKKKKKKKIQFHTRSKKTITLAVAGA